MKNAFCTLKFAVIKNPNAVYFHLIGTPHITGLLNIMLTWQIRVAYYYNTKTFCIELQKLRDEKLKPLRAQSKIYFSFVIESTN
ncbi:hypothetical protein QMN07_16930 [Leptospira santarosai]|uniref:hypothetical protein n=1 Tax=Leptospira santarosai TaxID=28183 RepID=UPI0024AEF2A4|nr:hypothetical protein [Leptospira santarosai]MDI7219182.1 hypothetical protein [Leptospira santarosai]